MGVGARIWYCHCECGRVCVECNDSQLLRSHARQQKMIRLPYQVLFYLFQPNEQSWHVAVFIFTQYLHYGSKCRVRTDVFALFCNDICFQYATQVLSLQRKTVLGNSGVIVFQAPMEYVPSFLYSNCTLGNTTNTGPTSLCCNGNNNIFR